MEVKTSLVGRGFVKNLSTTMWSPTPSVTWHKLQGIEVSVCKVIREADSRTYGSFLTPLDPELGT